MSKIKIRKNLSKLFFSEMDKIETQEKALFLANKESISLIKKSKCDRLSISVNRLKKSSTINLEQNQVKVLKDFLNKYF